MWYVCSEDVRIPVNHVGGREGDTVKAAVRVNGAPAAQHVGAFSAFTCEVTGLLKPTGNVLEIVADNAYDPDVPPTEGDFTVFGGVYRDVWWIEKPAVCVDPLRHVRLHPDAATGRVRAEVPVSGGPDEVQTFDFGAPELWSPESPRLYRLTVTAGTDRVTVPFGFGRSRCARTGSTSTACGGSCAASAAIRTASARAGP